METDTKQPQQVALDPDRQKKAREYARIRRRLSYISMAIGAIGIVIFLATDLKFWLRDALHGLSWQPISGWYPWQILVYFLILMLGYQILIAPLAYLSGFVLPHRYGISTMTLKSWLADLFKGLVLGLILEGLVIELVYALLAAQPQIWWLEVAVVLL